MPQKDFAAQNNFYVVVSQGDVAGIGYPLFLRVLEQKQNFFQAKELSLFSKIIFVGDLYPKDEKRIKKIFQLENIPQSLTEIPFLLKKKKSLKPLFLIDQKGKTYEPGKPSTSLALRSYQILQQSLKILDVLSDKALLTLPVSKEFIQKAGVSFAGHTEVLAHHFQKSVFMCLYHPRLSVIPLTNHIALGKVPKKIYEINVQALAEALFFFRLFTGTKKKFGLTGLNPHAGEGGVLGTEEEFLKKVIADLAKDGVDLVGPLSADGAFSVEGRKDFSLLVTCYHDQGLAPFKALFGLKGINITLNLPIMRVSPDHGTAYCLAAQGLGSPVSIVNSLRLALNKGKLWKKVYSYR